MTDKNPLIEPHDILAAFSMLTRLRLCVDHIRAGKRGANCAWAFPVVGLFLGVGVGVLALVLRWLGLPSGVTAACVLLALAMITGALHEDGLADFTDGVWAGKTPQKRLEIMKDSRIGAYGAIALVVFLLARHSGIQMLYGWNIILSLAAVGATSRAAMAGVMFILDPVRPDGLSASAGQPDARHVAVALAIGFAACVLLTGFSGIVLFVVILLAAVPVCVIALKKLGGQTGDVLGAVHQCCEAVGLAAAFALA